MTISHHITKNTRYGVLAGAVLVQLCIGAIYTWSLFNQPLSDLHGWRREDIVLTYSILHPLSVQVAGYGDFGTCHGTIDLVEQKNRVHAAGFFQALDELAGIGTDVGAAVAAYFRLVLDPAQ